MCSSLELSETAVAVHGRFTKRKLCGILCEQVRHAAHFGAITVSPALLLPPLLLPPLLLPLLLLLAAGHAPEQCAEAVLVFRLPCCCLCR
jgi:hypothetical protein